MKIERTLVKLEMTEEEFQAIRLALQSNLTEAKSRVRFCEEKAGRYAEPSPYHIRSIELLEIAEKAYKIMFGGR